MNGKFGRVFDGRSFQDVVPPKKTPWQNPLPVGLQSEIFVSLPQFRDGKRCAQSVQRLFASASNPDRVIVGLIEQTDTEHPQDDPTCLEEYCALLGHKMKEHKPGFAHKGEKQADWDRVMEECPRTNQIRSVRFHHFASKVCDVIMKSYNATTNAVIFFFFF